MTLDKSFNVVEPRVKRAIPDHGLAPAWCTMWLEQRNIEDPTEAQIDEAIAAYRERVGLRKT